MLGEGSAVWISSELTCIRVRFFSFSVQCSRPQDCCYRCGGVLDCVLHHLLR